MKTRAALVLVLVLATGCASSRAMNELRLRVEIAILQSEIGLEFGEFALRAIETDECIDVIWEIGGGSQYASMSTLAANATAPEILAVLIAKFEARSDTDVTTMINGRVEIHRTGQCDNADGFALALAAEDP